MKNQSVVANNDGDEVMKKKKKKNTLSWLKWFSVNFYLPPHKLI